MGGIAAAACLSKFCVGSASSGLLLLLLLARAFTALMQEKNVKASVWWTSDKLMFSADLNVVTGSVIWALPKQLGGRVAFVVLVTAGVPVRKSP